MPDPAPILLDGFDRLERRFRAITRRAADRFAARDWNGLRRDAAERIDLYEGVIDAVQADLQRALGPAFRDRATWTALKPAFGTAVRERTDVELAQTFFNSLTRRALATVGVDPEVEFTDADHPPRAARPVYRVVEGRGTLKEQFAEALAGLPFADRYEDAGRDAEALAGALKAHLRGLDGAAHVDRTEWAEPVFYRGDGAFLVGRVFAGPHVIPVALALRNDPPESDGPQAYEGPGGVRADALLLGADEVSVLFSFARSAFLVDAACPYDLVRFLKAVLPQKRVAELYISLGHHKHGKTELFRDLQRHLAQADPDEQLERAPGQRGMVMITLAMPGYDLVLKMIKDRFERPKTVTRAEVKERYRLVFRHDRAGRLVDAQPFEHLVFERARFSDALLEELAEVAPEQVSVSDEHVALAFAYLERRVTPLDLYVREHGEAALPVVLDFGHALRDLVASGLFPGDLLLKNFGVTRHGRVVFYDYDEIDTLAPYVFRDKPEPLYPWQEMAAEPWYSVGPHDVFPEEFQAALGLPRPLMEAFLKAHGELFTAAWWQRAQERLRRGDRTPIVPYPAHRRLGTDAREQVRAQPLTNPSETGASPRP